ncbi:MAG: FliO/MopB family protein [Deltaproteobacteria bacterium]|nr:FliO/MopB family protein [Deltaproteobacteria bacterium]
MTRVLWFAFLLSAPLVAGAAPAPVAPPPTAITKETRPELFQDEPPPRPGSASQPAEAQPKETTTGFWLMMLLRTMIVLGVVVLLAYLILNKGLSRLMKLTGVKQGKNLTLIERLALDQKHSLFIIEIDGRRLVVGTSEHQTSLVCDLGVNRGMDRGVDREAASQIREISVASAMTESATFGDKGKT